MGISEDSLDQRSRFPATEPGQPRRARSSTAATKTGTDSQPRMNGINSWLELAENQQPTINNPRSGLNPRGDNSSLTTVLANPLPITFRYPGFDRDSSLSLRGTVNRHRHSNQADQEWGSHISTPLTGRNNRLADERNDERDNLV